MGCIHHTDHTPRNTCLAHERVSKCLDTLLKKTHAWGIPVFRFVCGLQTTFPSINYSGCCDLRRSQQLQRHCKWFLYRATIPNGPADHLVLSDFGIFQICKLPRLIGIRGFCLVMFDNCTLYMSVICVCVFVRESMKNDISISKCVLDYYLYHVYIIYIYIYIYIYVLGSSLECLF